MEEMARQQVGRLPIVDPGGRVIGVVTLSSLALRSPKQQEALETAQEVSRRSARVA
jgi:signal-transduction protein with cAMP-binding, CBS, and nucleotidyltransferase domain